MLTLRHFLDRPAWAAAAGYKFNILDCMAYSACLYENVISGLRNVSSAFLDQQVRELPAFLLAWIALLMGAIVWPLTFWLLGIVLWFRCHHFQRKYRGTDSEIVLKNLRSWQHECEKRWSRGA